MIDSLHQHMTDTEVHRLVLFAGASLLGMLFAYIKRWSDNELPVKLTNYLVGDSHAVARACTALVLLLGGAEAMGHLAGMTDMQILSSGAAVGLMVPSVADSKKVESIAYEELVDKIREAAVLVPAEEVGGSKTIRKDPT